MLKMMLWFGLVLISTTNYAETAGMPLMSTSIDLSDKAALQRGAKLFMNYCAGCHSLKYLRYNQMAKGLGLMTFDGQVDKPLLKNNLIFTQAPIGEPIKVSMSPKDAREWFGKVPPDLSLVSRVRGSNWLYTYLHGFYQDPKRPFGSNNWLFPDVGMPNVLAPLQGIQVAQYKKQIFDFDGEKKEVKVIKSLLEVEHGSMTEHQFDTAVHDIVAFLTYVGEPIKQTRQWYGFWVIAFMVVFTALLYALKKSYWMEVKK